MPVEAPATAVAEGTTVAWVVAAGVGVIAWGVAVGVGVVGGVGVSEAAVWVVGVAGWVVEVGAGGSGVAVGSGLVG